MASKAAALALLLRLAVGLGSVPLNDIDPPQAEAVHQEAVLNDVPATRMVAFESEEVEVGSSEAVEAVGDAPAEEAVVQHDPRVEIKQAYDEALTPVRNFISLLVAFFAVVTATFGNLAAYGQKNIKRLLAYSTIAHAGYMMMAISPLMVMLGTDNNAAEAAASALIQYLVVYVCLLYTSPSPRDS